MEQTLTEKIAIKNSCNYTEDELTRIKGEFINKPKIAIIMLGLPGSGKSTVKKIFVETYLHRKMEDFIDCDPDLIMQKLSAFTVNTSNTKENAASSCFYNSREINDIIYTTAIHERLNIILDGTGQDYIWTTGQIKILKNIGYIIYICIVTIDLEEAKQRVKARAIINKRLINDEIITKIHNNLVQAIELYKINTDAKGVVIYDNSGTIEQLKITYEHPRKNIDINELIRIKTNEIELLTLELNRLKNINIPKRGAASVFQESQLTLSNRRRYIQKKNR
jgi:predicted ABC-type ATPase